MNIEIDFLAYKKELQLKKTGTTKTEIYDPVRRKYLLLQPEELVRQLVLCYLKNICLIPIRQIRTEFGIQVNSLQKRCDIVVFDYQIRPRLIVECKAANVPITQATFDQVARYNLRLQVPFLMVTNGITTFCSRVFLAESQLTEGVELLNQRYFEFLEKVPTFEELNKIS
jgi:hypothetical protein